jgi:hypothetical protein
VQDPVPTVLSSRQTFPWQLNGVIQRALRKHQSIASISRANSQRDLLKGGQSRVRANPALAAVRRAQTVSEYRAH